MNENSKKGAIVEGISLVIGGLIQILTKGGIQHTKKLIQIQRMKE